MLATLEAARELKYATLDTIRDIREGVRRSSYRDALFAELSALPQALTKTAPWLLKARNDADLSLIRLVLEHAEAAPDALALEMEDKRLSWRDLAEQTSRVAYALSSYGIKKGDVVALVGRNSPEYIAIVLGASRLGAIAALINHHLEGEPLEHAILASKARIAIVDSPFVDAVKALPKLREQLRRVVSYREGELEEKMAKASRSPLARVPVPVSSDFVYIYTSGTTGLPKPSHVSHARALVAGAGFGQLVHAFREGDKLYCALPLYHSSALLLGLGSCLVTRTPMAMRESFSASAFWKDVNRYRATHMIYIGELCRYLLNTKPSPEERDHTLRVAVGNGLRADVWEAFASRFRIETIREFYAATEAPNIILNLAGRPGSVGRVPFRRLSPLRLVRYDADSDTHPRDRHGHLIECGPSEVGELIIRLSDKPLTAITDFRGYTDKKATEEKILRDVFRSGDRWYRSGDLLRYDEDDFFYFVDRIGDTYRWKGENISTAEVEDVLSREFRARELTVVGVSIPGMEGQAGLAAISPDEAFDAEAFFQAAQGLPAYARPRFVRIVSSLSTTGTLKIQKSELRRDGADPRDVKDPLWVLGEESYLPLTPEIWDEITAGRFRL